MASGNVTHQPRTTVDPRIGTSTADAGDQGAASRARAGLVGDPGGAGPSSGSPPAGRSRVECPLRPAGPSEVVRRRPDRRVPASGRAGRPSVRRRRGQAVAPCASRRKGADRAGLGGRPPAVRRGGGPRLAGASRPVRARAGRSGRHLRAVRVADRGRAAAVDGGRPRPPGRRPERRPRRSRLAPIRCSGPAGCSPSSSRAPRRPSGTTGPRPRAAGRRTAFPVDTSVAARRCRSR